MDRIIMHFTLSILIMCLTSVSLKPQPHNILAYFTPKGEANCCDYWIYQITGDISKQNSFMEYQGNSVYVKDDEKSIMCGIECLLKLEGDKRISNIGANLSLNTSRTDIPNPTVEIAALYKISAIFGCAQDVHVIILRDKEGNGNGQNAINKAYKYYREWFKKIKSMGLKKARLMQMNPLKNKDIYWD
jgi:hypothetical protein